MSDVPFLAVTGGQFMTSLQGFRESGLIREPNSGFLCPTSVRRLWHLNMCDQCLVPTVGL